MVRIEGGGRRMWSMAWIMPLVAPWIVWSVREKGSNGGGGLTYDNDRFEVGDKVDV
jgi:hypothetical protein